MHWDHPRKALIGIYYFAKFGWNRCSSFENMEVFIFYVFCFKTPTYAPKKCFFWLTPWILNVIFETIKRYNSGCESTSFEPLSVKIGRKNVTSRLNRVTVKRKVLPYSLPSVGPGADPGVQAVSTQVTWSHPPGGRLPLLSARPAVTFPAEERHLPSAGTKSNGVVFHACADDA